MAQRLVNITQGNAVIANEVRHARTFLERAIGLMGKKNLPLGETLFFKGTKFASCNSVHTHFMRFPIDVVFVDDKLTVRSIVRDLKPWRITWPVKGATSAFEFVGGTLAALPGSKLAIGDVLHVGD